VIRHANAFALGAQLMHPGAKVKLVWTNSWFDPTKEKKAAQSLHTAGVDVLGQNVDSPATASSRSRSGPLGRLRLERRDVRAEVLADRVRLQLGAVLPAAREGRRWPEHGRPALLREHQGRLHEAGTVRASVSAATKAAIAKKMQQIENGSFYEFAGPLLRQSGKLRPCKGQADDGD